MSRSPLLLALGCLVLSGCRDLADVVVDVRRGTMNQPIQLFLCSAADTTCTTKLVSVFEGSPPSANEKELGIYVDDDTKVLRLHFTYAVNLTVGAGSKNLCTEFHADLGRGQVAFAVEFPDLEEGRVMDTCSEDPSCSPASCL